MVCLIILPQIHLTLPHSWKQNVSGAECEGLQTIVEVEKNVGGIELIHPHQSCLFSVAPPWLNLVCKLLGAY